VTSSRFLPILNLVGCLLITVVIVAQWLKERGLGERIASISQELVISRDQTAEAEKRVIALESDVAQLKEAIEATTLARKEAEEAARTEVEKITTGHNEKIAELTTASEERVKTWEAAIATRDEKIRALNATLTSTRERLDEAIAKLKEAGAR
jgi:chromosome segregation ATPase